MQYSNWVERVAKWGLEAASSWRGRYKVVQITDFHAKWDFQFNRFELAGCSPNRGMWFITFAMRNISFSITPFSASFFTLDIEGQDLMLSPKLTGALRLFQSIYSANPIIPVTWEANLSMVWGCEYDDSVRCHQVSYCSYYQATLSFYLLLQVSIMHLVALSLHL